MARRNHTTQESRLFGSSCSAALFQRIKSRRDPDSQSGMLALRAFSVGHFAAKLAWSSPISLSNPSREKNICTGPDCKQLVHRLKHINDAHNEIFTRPMRSSLSNTEIFTRLVKTGSNESAAFKGPFIERHASACRRVMFIIEAF